MKAAVVNAPGVSPAIEMRPDPVAGTGEIVIDVAAAPMLAYAGEVFRGDRPMLMRPPFVPGTGAIGRVREAGRGATRLQPGDWVFADPTLRSRDGGGVPDIVLQGLTAASERATALLPCYGDGSFAEQLLMPAENVFPLGDMAADDAARWCAIGRLLVPFGGLLAVSLNAGESVVVNGATGNFGSAAVMVALAMGAGRVVATGRNATLLYALQQRFGERVCAAVMTGDETTDRATILAAAGPVDVVLDLLPPAASIAQVSAAIMAVREYGRVVLMGGVGMTGGQPLTLDYPWLMRRCVTLRGQWMYPPAAVPRMIAMIRAGLIDLGAYQVTAFRLEEINAAVEHAAANAGAFRMTVVTP